MGKIASKLSRLEEQVRVFRRIVEEMAWLPEDRGLGLGRPIMQVQNVACEALERFKLPNPNHEVAEGYRRMMGESHAGDAGLNDSAASSSFSS